MKAFAITLLMGMSTLAWGEPGDLPTAISEYQKQDWQVEDGLPQGNIRALAQRHGGPLLVGTSGGLVSFDGLHFTPVKVDDKDEVANEPINALLFSHTGDLWIGTDDRGIIRKRGQTSVEFSENAGLHQERVRRMLEDRSGVIWVATQNGIERIVEDKVECLTALGVVSGDITSPFAEDGYGGVFIVTSKGIFLWRHSDVQPFPVGHDELGGVTATYGDGKGSVWIGRAQGLLQLVFNATGHYSERVQKGIHAPVTTLLQDRDGYVWVGTRNDGICRISNSSVAHWRTRDGLPDETIRSLFADDEGDLWIGTIGGGLSRWRKAVLVPFGTPEGVPQSVAANVLGDSRGNLWLGTWGSGLLRIRQGHLQQEHLPGTPLLVPIRALAEDGRGDVWIGTWFNGLYRYDGTRFQHFLIGTESPANAISALLSDRHGALWVGTYKGLVRFAKGIPQKNAGELFLANKLVTSIKETTDSKLMVGTFTGLYLLDGSSVQEITHSNGLSNPFILSVSVDSVGGVWVGTQAGGIDYIHGGSVIHLGTEKGMPDFPVFSVLDDGHGSLWMSTPRGLLRVPVEQIHAVAEGKRATVDTVLLGRNDGMRSSECSSVSQPSAARAKDGTLWFATAKGFVHTSGSSEPQPIDAPVVHIQGFTIDNTPLLASDHLTVSPGASDLRFEFGTIRLSNPQQIQFRYKLDGYDRDWTVKRARHAEYKQLPPGHYRLLVAARDEGMKGVPWSEAATVDVEKLPFFYQTIWFYFLLTTCVASLVLLLFRRHLAQVKARMAMIIEERNRIAGEWHDSLLADFAAISWQLEATKEKFTVHSSDATSSLDLARNMVKHCQAEARRIIWDLRDRSKTVGSLSEVLSEKLGALKDNAGINAEITVSGTEAPLPQLATHHLACICQEAVSNAIRHAAPKHIEVGLEYTEKGVKLSVKDDGHGFPPSRSHASVDGHFGLLVMQERVQKLGGHLEVRSAVGTGTEILVDVPAAYGAISK